MPQINLGTVANDNTGSPLRTGGQLINQYGLLGDKTVNAAFYKTATVTNEAAITLAIVAAVSLGTGAAVWVPASMLPYNASLVTFNTAVKMLCEGGSLDGYDLRAYGATLDGIADDTTASTTQANAVAGGALPRMTSIIIPPARTALISAAVVAPPTIVMTQAVGSLPKSGAPGVTSDLSGQLFFRAGGGAYNAAANLANSDEVGFYIRKYGQISAMGAARVAEGIVAECDPQFTFTSPSGGDVVAGEFMTKLQGLATGGNYQGTLFGCYGHTDFTGTGNNAIVDTAVGVWGDIGLFSSGNNFTVTKAVGVVARQPQSTNIGTITSFFGIYTDGKIGVGPWPALGTSFSGVTQQIVLDPGTSQPAVTINQNAAAAALTIGGVSGVGASAIFLGNSWTVTGSSATIAMNLAPSWNTSGAPTVLQMNINYTAAAATAKFLDCQIGGSSRFTVFASGNTQHAVDNSLTFTNQTSAAGASAGTLTNAPAATNPNFWLRVQVNGVNRFIPCW